jgi:hypothetical protein
MKKILSLMLIVVLGLTIVGCSEENSSDSKQSSQQEKILKEATNQTGMPNISNFTERKMMKDILELRDKSNLITYVYTQNQMDGKWVYQGKAIGFGLPYSTEYTNPEKIADSLSQGGYAILPQADPNGLFSSQNTSATWIMMINPTTNEPEVQYMEPNTYITQTKVRKELCEAYSLPADY